MDIVTWWKHLAKVTIRSRHLAAQVWHSWKNARFRIYGHKTDNISKFESKYWLSVYGPWIIDLLDVSYFFSMQKISCTQFCHKFKYRKKCHVIRLITIISKKKCLKTCNKRVWETTYVDQWASSALHQSYRQLSMFWSIHICSCFNDHSALERTYWIVSIHTITKFDSVDPSQSFQSFNSMRQKIRCSLIEFTRI